ncbi:serine protease 57 isoform X4 [Marmota marmota marmota]|uniref:serine protease 57 isoform X4 n=1 Tax=Marmota marmota marmota TaxID=9994 RepID=UPI002093FBB9|nr:serine protease 57 isoform X4 [Marmota marmota marmota]
MGPRLGDWGRLLLTLAAALTLPTRAPGKDPDSHPSPSDSRRGVPGGPAPGRGPGAATQLGMGPQAYRVPRPLQTLSPAPVCLCLSPTLPCAHLPGARPGPSHSCPTAGSLGAQIIGGHEVTPHSRPYMASVSFRGQHHCGGFLLRSRWVVSAAHCFSHRDPREALVVLGAHTLRPQEPTRQVFGIAAVTRHPDYQSATHANDICLLRMGKLRQASSRP